MVGPKNIQNDPIWRASREQELGEEILAEVNRAILGDPNVVACRRAVRALWERGDLEEMHRLQGLMREYGVWGIGMVLRGKADLPDVAKLV